MDSGLTTPSSKSIARSVSNQQAQQAETEVQNPPLVSGKTIKVVRSFIAEVANSLVKPRTPPKRVQRVMERVDSTIQDFHERVNGFMERNE